MLADPFANTRSVLEGWGNSLFAVAFPEDGIFNSKGEVPRQIVLTRSAVCVIFFLSVWGLAMLVLKVWSPGTKQIYGARHGSWALNVMTLFHHSTSAVWSLLFISQDSVLKKILSFRGGIDEARAMLVVNTDLRPLDSSYGFVANTDLSPPDRSYGLLIPYTIGYMCVDLLLSGYWPKDPEKFVFIIHHALCIYAWTEGLHYDWGVRYAVFLISTELTGVFMVLRWMLSQANLKSSVFYLVNGTLFTVLYIILRVSFTPAILFSTFMYPPRSEPMRDDTMYLKFATNFACMLMYVPYLLNCYWATKVVRGYIKGIKSWIRKDD